MRRLSCPETHALAPKPRVVWKSVVSAGTVGQAETMARATFTYSPNIMNNNQLPAVQTFDFAPGVALRSITKDSEPWFIAADVCAALSITNASQAVQALDPDQHGLTSTDTPGGRQSVLAVSESGLYSLVLRSRKPAAKDFRKWVTGTVLPTLRRDGLYVAGQEKPITDDLTLPELLAQIEGIQAKVDALKASQVRAWSRHQEEKDARRQALRFLR